MFKVFDFEIRIRVDLRLPSTLYVDRPFETTHDEHDLLHTRVTEVEEELVDVLHLDSIP
jgi:hypothetical protein